MSRKIVDMDESLQQKYAEFCAKMAEAGLPIILTQTLRTVAEHRALYAQGRESLSVVNQLRKIAGLAPITAEQNKRQVTWTKNTRHFPNKEGKSEAFDFVICKNGVPQWSGKVDIDNDGVADYDEAGAIVKSIPGLKWGGSFGDLLHVELS